MKRPKPIRSFLVHVEVRERTPPFESVPAGTRTIRGESFFLARAALAVELGVDPDDIRPWPGARYA